MLSSVSFGYSDLWSAGTLIYEIYGLDNPFSPTAAAASVTSPRRKTKQLDSATYKESQLPRLPRSAPTWIRHLAADILRRNPRAVRVLCSCTLFCPVPTIPTMLPDYCSLTLPGMLVPPFTPTVLLHQSPVPL